MQLLLDGFISFLKAYLTLNTSLQFDSNSLAIINIGI